MESKMNFIQPKTENQLKIENLLTKISEMDSKTLIFPHRLTSCLLARKIIKRILFAKVKKANQQDF